MRFFRSRRADDATIDLFSIAHRLDGLPVDTAPFWMRKTHNNAIWQSTLRTVGLPSIVLSGVASTGAITVLPYYPHSYPLLIIALMVGGGWWIMMSASADTLTLTHSRQMAARLTWPIAILALLVMGLLPLLSIAWNMSGTVTDQDLKFILSSLGLAAAVVGACLLLMTMSPPRIRLYQRPLDIGAESWLPYLVTGLCIAAVALAFTMLFSSPGIETNRLGVVSAVLIVAVPSVTATSTLARRRRLFDDAIGRAYLDTANVLRTWRRPRPGRPDNADAVMATVTQLHSRPAAIAAMESVSRERDAVPNGVRLLHEFVDARRRGLDDSPDIRAHRSVYDFHFRHTDVRELMEAYGRCCEEFSRQLLGRRTMKLPPSA